VAGDSRGGVCAERWAKVAAWLVKEFGQGITVEVAPRRVSSIVGNAG
jgi:hypothetical protein